MAASSLKIPKAPVVKPIAPGSSTSKPDAPKTTVAPKNLSATLPKKAAPYQRYTDPITGAKYQYINGAWKMISGATGTALGRLPITTPRLSGSESSGETIATPPTTPTTPAPAPSYDYSAGFAADPRYAPGIANIAANQVGIGNQYGLVINRDMNPSSPTYGMAMWLAPGQEPGTGTITAKIDPVTGLSVYSDATGKVFDVKDITIDIRELKPGEPGYLKGSIGNTTAQSQNQQYNIGNQAAQGGARRSGMRSSVAAMEVGALQGALSNLGLGFGAAFRGTTDQYANLLNAIFPDQAEKAAALASAPGTGTGTGTDGGTGTGGGTPPVDPYKGLPSNTTAPESMPVPDRAGYTEIGTPTGSNLPKNPKPGVVFKGAGGVTFVYRENGPDGAGWYKRAVTSGTGAGTGGGGAGGAGGGGGAPPPPVVDIPWWDKVPPNSTSGDQIPSSSRGGFTVKGNPTGSNKPRNPVGGTVFKGAGGELFVWRTDGPSGQGWYKKP